jgi:DNA-binding beta-propeller fold protein YncE
MKMGKWARLLLAAAPLVAGCGDFWQAPSSTSSTTTTTTTLSSGYFYVLDSATSQVIAYDIASGTLTEVASYPLPSAPLAIAVAPNNEFLYVSTLNGIYLYTISSGALSTSPALITTDPATAMQVDTTDSWLVEASGSGYIYAIPIVSGTGALNGSCSTCHVPLTGNTVNQLAIAPDNDYIFVAGGLNGTAAFTFTAGNTSDPLRLRRLLYSRGRDSIGRGRALGGCGSQQPPAVH